MTGMSDTPSAPAMDAPTESFADQPAETSAQSTERRRVKIDGIEQEIDVDSVLKDYQKYKSSEKRFQEAAALRKEAQAEREIINQVLNRAQSGDLSWLKGLVPDDKIRGWAEQELLQHLDWEQKPEMEREAITAKRERDELKRQLEELNQTKEKEESSKLEEQVYQEVEQDIIAAIKEMGTDIKITPLFVQRMAEYMQASLEASNDPHAMPAKKAADKSLRRLKSEAQELLGILSPEEVLQMLPPNIRKAARMDDVEKAIAQAPMMRARREQVSSYTPQKSKLRHGTSDDAFKRLEKLYS